MKPRTIGRGRVAMRVAAGIGATAAVAPAAQAADISVTSTADSGPGSLRQAIATANLDPFADRILFQSGLSGMIKLESNLPNLNSAVSIEGPGASQLAVDGDKQFRMFKTLENISISDLTLRDSLGVGDGSAVFALTANIELDGVRLSGNSSDEDGGAVSIYGGSLQVRDSDFTGNSSGILGGAIVSQAAAMTISGSTFAGNTTVGYGGAIALRAGSLQTTISGSSFTGNGAGVAGGALIDIGSAPVDISASLIADNSTSISGGGLYFSGGGVNSIRNSTLTANTANQSGGGINSNADSLELESSTLSGNTTTSPVPPQARGAGLHLSDATATLNNSIVSANIPADLSTAAAATISGSFNLIGDRTSALFAETVPGSNITSTSPQLAALADNGGATRTMLPALDSSAVNKGSSSLATDQRGLTRPVSFPGVPFSTAAGADGADMGAVEVQIPAPAPSNNFTFGKVKLNKKKGVATLQVKVPGAGKVVLIGSKTVKGQKKAAKKKSTLKLTIKARGKAAKQLRKRGKAKVRAKVKFTPTGGEARTKSKTVKLVKKRKR